MSDRTRKKVSFCAKQVVNKRVGVSFRTGSGKRVTFVANKKVPVAKRVTFYAKKHK